MKSYTKISAHKEGNRITVKTGRVNNSFNTSQVENIGGVKRTNRIINNMERMERVESTMIDVIDFRAQRKSGALRR